MANAYIRTSTSLSIFFDNGSSVTVYPNNPDYAQIVAALALKDYNTALKLTAPVDAVKEKLAVVASRSGGKAKLDVRAGVVYFGDEPLHNTLTDRIVSMSNEGYDVQPMLRFLENLKQNPSYRAVNELLGFLDYGKLPITEDGYFLAYKRVRGDYTDCHTGKFNNSVGTVVSMPRNEVNENPEETCSAGLHFCSREYLPSFGTCTGNRTVILKINPADVVAIPKDYNNTKGRTCRYEVIGELIHQNEAPLEGAYRSTQDYVVTPNVEDLGPNYTYTDNYECKEEDDCGSVIQAIDPTNLTVIADFNSITDAAIWASVQPSAITRVIRGNRKTTGGFIWRSAPKDIGPIVDATTPHPDHLANLHEHGTLYNGAPHSTKVYEDFADDYDDDGYDDDRF